MATYIFLMESTTERVKGEEEGIGDAMVNKQRAVVRKQFMRFPECPGRVQGEVEVEVVRKSGEALQCGDESCDARPV